MWVQYVRLKQLNDTPVTIHVAQGHIYTRPTLGKQYSHAVHGLWRSVIVWYVQMTVSVLQSSGWDANVQEKPTWAQNWCGTLLWNIKANLIL